MTETFLATSSSARLAKVSGAIGRIGAQYFCACARSIPIGNLPYTPPDKIGVSIAPGHNTLTCIPFNSASIRKAFDKPTTANLLPL